MSDDKGSTLELAEKGGSNHNGCDSTSTMQESKCTEEYGTGDQESKTTKEHSSREEGSNTAEENRSNEQGSKTTGEHRLSEEGSKTIQDNRSSEQGSKATDEYRLSEEGSKGYKNGAADREGSYVGNENENKSGDQQHKTFWQMTMKEKTQYVREVITIEPLLVCYFMASVLCAPALLVLEFEKACRVNLGYEDKVCNDIVNSDASNYTTETVEIQKKIADMHSWQQPLQNIMPIILILFLGSYSDRHKIRKPFLLVPILGEFLAVVGCILCVVFMETWPLEAQGIFQTVIPSFFGGPSMVIMASFSYIADISTEEMRTLRVGVVQFVLTLCSPIVQSFSGKLFVTIGYLWVLLIGAALFAAGLMYGIFCIKEPKMSVGLENKKSLIKDLFDPRHAIETFNVLIKKKKGNRRLLLILLILCLFIWSGVNQGEISVFYLFVVKVYDWGAVEYSLFGTVNTVIHLIGTAISIPLLSAILKLNDLIIAALSFLDKVLCNIVFAAYLTPWGLYIGTIISIITPIASIAMRSQVTKVVHVDDLGKAQSLFAITEAIAPSIFTPIYNTVIYINTVETFAGAYFIVGAVLQLVGVAILMLMYYTVRKKSERAIKRSEKELYAYDSIFFPGLETTHI